MNDEYYITSDITQMDTALIHDYLCNTSYWAKGRSLERVVESMENSLCFAVFTKEHQQIGFARVATDYVVFAWLMDVFVLDAYQRKGIGKLLLQHIINHPKLNQVNGFGLRTNDAHSFYSSYGFKRIPELDTWLFKSNKA